jgi:UDPglucose 6-dehydrogenase
MHVCVVGAGRLGMPYGVSLARLGHYVLMVDTNEAVIARVNARQAPFDEPGLAVELAAQVAAGRLQATTSFAAAADHASLHIVCVGTPQQSGSVAADLRDLTAAFDAIVQHAKRDSVILGKSSVPVGTAAALANQARRVGSRIEVAWSPDFLRESTSLVDAARPDRIILGLPHGSQLAEPMLRTLWAPLLAAGVPLIVTDTASAELAKYAANSFLATKTSFINMVASVADRAGADIIAIAQALALDPRIGPAALQPGIGWGGTCLPKDLRAFAASARRLGLDQHVRILDHVDILNQQSRDQIVDLARDACGGRLMSRRIAVWGCAFKPGTDDISHSPALAIAAAMRRLGAYVTCHDPAAMPAAANQHPELNYAATAHAALDRADLLLHLTDWLDYRAIDPAALTEAVRRPYLIDGRTTLDRDTWQAAGWTYRAIGRTATNRPGSARPVASSKRD